MKPNAPPVKDNHVGLLTPASREIRKRCKVATAPETQELEARFLKHQVQNDNHFGSTDRRANTDENMEQRWEQRSSDGSGGSGGSGVSDGSGDSGGSGVSDGSDGSGGSGGMCEVVVGIVVVVTIMGVAWMMYYNNKGIYFLIAPPLSLLSFFPSLSCPSPSLPLS